MNEQAAALAELARRELARRSYADYLSYIQGGTWVRTRLSELIAERVQNFLEGQTGHAYDILVIETPPQHGKSMTVTETLPSWYMGHHPYHRVIIASYDSDFAEKFCRRNKEKIKSAGKNLFGISVGKVDRAQEFELSNGRGRFISRGIMSGDTIVRVVEVDDASKPIAYGDAAVNIG